MPASSSKNQQASNKNSAIIASDLGINMKPMYKQLANTNGLAENKNYLNSNIQPAPAPQLQATKVINSNLNQTAHISIKPVGGEPISLSQNPGMNNTIPNQSYLSDLFKQTMSSKQQDSSQYNVPGYSSTPG